MSAAFADAVRGWSIADADGLARMIAIGASRSVDDEDAATLEEMNRWLRTLTGKRGR